MIAHPSLVEPDGGGPVEEQHITHKVSQQSHNLLTYASLGCSFY